MRKPGQMPRTKIPMECDVIVSFLLYFGLCKYFFQEAVAKLELQNSKDKLCWFPPPFLLIKLYFFLFITWQIKRKFSVFLSLFLKRELNGQNGMRHSYRLCACKCQGWDKAKISHLLLQPNHSPLPHSSLFPAFWRETQSSACGRPCCVSTVNLKSSNLLCLLIPKANRNALEGQRTSALGILSMGILAMCGPLS